jgi:hypothetical protein
MWNDKETEIDLLGHDKLAQTVIEIIQDNHLRPLTIGVYGDWGVGKSSILSVLQKKVQELTKQKIAKTHCIVFNGWLFQGFEDAKSALMETIVAELASIQPGHKKVQKLATSLIRRVNWLKVAKVGAGAAFTALTGMPNPGMLSGFVGMVKKGKEVLGEHLPAKDDDESFLKEYQEQTITGQIHAFRQEFAELIKTSKVDHIIILVDDLDRCLPKAVIETLEAIRLFLFVEGTTFVISADERMIEYAVREHFPNLPASYADYTKSYLEKLIQIPIRIPLLNRLQTGNYIKLLLLQEYLKHDYEKLITVYNYFGKQKKNPYDPVELSYDVITTALDETNETLNEAILVGGHLTPTLSTGLKGNPRNIKRFLNTLFLRLRVAKIYGLEGVIRLNVLAKLMLLERFQGDRYTALVDEVSMTTDGISKTLVAIESQKAAGDEARGQDTKPPAATSKEETVKEEFDAWVKIEPKMAKTDLLPYIFISREKAIGFDAETEMSAGLLAILGQLSSGSTIALTQAETALGKVSSVEATELFRALENEIRAIADVRTEPNAMKGLFRIIAKHPDLEERLVHLVNSYPTQSLGLWALSEFSGLKTPAGLAAFKLLLKNCAQQTENRTLKTLAEQLSNK